PAIFVSHSHKDDEYCHSFVADLRAAGLDVWFDEHNASAGHLVDLIERELRLRPIFVVVLSPAALVSQWVKDECTWAFGRYRRDPAHRVILPVLAKTVDEDDIWLFMQEFKRIEQAGLRPWPATEAARRVALAVDLNTPVAPPQRHATFASPPPPGQSDNADALLARANALVSQGKRREAIKVLRRATALAPRSVAVWNALGFNLDYSGHDLEALEAFERALLLEPANAFAWAGKANALARGYPQQALVAAEKALSFDQASAYGFSAKGFALDHLGRRQEALDAYDRSTTLDPGFAIAWNNKGDALSNLGRHAEALDAYERVTVLDPSSSITWRNKGNELYRLGRQSGALDAYERATTLDPTYATAWNDKGFTLYGMGRYAEALDAYDHAIALGPNANRWRGKANALRQMGRTTEADEADRVARQLETKQ
ncbi:MAG TPA: toll/interleukin-1 receptor domain-containing protein, partial [Ktedonobacterales bacterium]